MPRTAITVVDVPGFGEALNNIKASGTAGDQANNHDIVPGDILLVMFNDSGGALTATVIGSASTATFNRTADVTISADAAQASVAHIVGGRGFLQSDGRIHVDLVDDTSITFAALRLVRTPG